MRYFGLCCLLAFSSLMPSTSWAQAKWEREWLHQLANNRTAGKNAFYSTISDMNSPVVLGVPLGWAAWGLIKKDAGMSLQSLNWVAAQFVNGALTYSLKATINRPRPAITDPTLIALENAKRFSFPSGHTSSAFALATSISLTHPKWYVIAPSYLYASLVGYSRCYLGVHYPSDVVAGAFVGAASAWATRKADKWLHQSKTKKKQQLSFAYLY